MHASEPRPVFGDDLHEVVVAPLAQVAGNIKPANLPASKKLKRSEEDPLPPLWSPSQIFTESPPWLFSAALHMLIVIILGLILITPQGREDLVLLFDYYDNEDPLSGGGDFDIPLDSPVEQIEDSLIPEPIPQVAEAVALSPTATETPLLARAMPLISDPIQMALSGRERGMQEALLDAYGGTAATQRAVLEALRWLSRNRSRDGTWSLVGPYEDGARSENVEAATAMALIAFQGAGYTPQQDAKDEPFAEVVSRAWTKLLSKQDDNGNFFESGQGTQQLYTHALCTIALCELYGMTQDARYRDPAQRAVDYCVTVQAPEGGWKYFPGTGSDLSVTGWFVMALQSARMAGLEVPTPCLNRIEKYLDSVSHEYGSQYSYQPERGPTVSMSAEGLLCRQYLGWGHDDERLVRGANLLMDHLPEWKRDRDVYTWYYATQVCHHMEGQHWRAWNDKMKVVIPQHQIQEGRERGSWDPQGFRWNGEGGRLFVTCLSTYMLEVYYRHLPIYQMELIGKEL
ncbi:prenyltransferase/squalene oxidase repeat-containing protein [Bythopirellula polymerisocia]|uniref:Pectic acid lyase n=1 Tax=Bythopirellula polymerisocia TaxID=2528003 RepID=A0A5C6C1F7_9BACT|nr:prenyltransferase/squalene oxidase repeat-containing protein [Bythopirellula polymerisocia]TWU17461.1 Pectic acid lyase [Bythopirellula polymerisocia]